MIVISKEEIELKMCTVRFIGLVLAVLLLLTAVPCAVSATTGPSQQDGASKPFLYLCDADNERLFTVVSYHNGLQINNEAVAGVSYDLAANTLTLNNVRLPGADLQFGSMGDDFTLALAGDNSLRSISLYNYGSSYSTALTIGGGGALTLNEDRQASRAVSFYSSGQDEMKLTVGADAKLHLYGDACFEATGTAVASADEVFTVGGKPVEGIQSELYSRAVPMNIGVLKQIENGPVLTGQPYEDRSEPGSFCIASPLENGSYSVAYLYEAEGLNSYIFDRSVIVSAAQLESAYAPVSRAESTDIVFYESEEQFDCRGFSGQQLTSQNDPDGVYAYAFASGDSGEVIRLQWDENESYYFRDERFAPVPLSADRLSQAGYAHVYSDTSEFVTAYVLNSSDFSDGSATGNLCRVLFRSSDPNSVYVEWSTDYTTFDEDEPNDYYVEIYKVAYNTQYDLYYFDEDDEDSERFLIPAAELNRNGFHYRTDRKYKEVCFLESGMSPFGIRGVRLEKAGEPGAVYAYDDWYETGMSGVQHTLYRLTYDVGRRAYFCETVEETVDLSQLAAMGYREVKSEVISELTIVPTVATATLPLLEDGDGNRYPCEGTVVYRCTGDAPALTVNGRDHYFISPAEGVRRVDLTRCTENVPSGMHYLLPSGEFHCGTQRLLGDADGDGAVTVNDVTTVQRYIAEFTVTDVFDKNAADVDGNGVVTVSDATAIQRRLAEY